MSRNVVLIGGSAMGKTETALINAMRQDKFSGLIVPENIAQLRQEEEDRKLRNLVIYAGVIKKVAAEIWERWTGEAPGTWTKIQIRTEVP